MQSAHEILKTYWGYDSFRTPQEEIINHVAQGNDTIALLPTGGGKSICFQVPALMRKGLCIVVSPLIALMKDQVDHLNKRGIKAEALHSGMHYKEMDRILDNAIQGMYSFLYVSPERLKTELFLARAIQMPISLLAIDEAHCISQWGYDFRPSYLDIISFRTILQDVPCIALTASATSKVVADIIQLLNLKKTKIFRKSFARENLSYTVLNEENKENKLLAILKKVQGSAVVYVRNRKRTKEISDFLQRNGISSSYYHAGLTHEERNSRQEQWISNALRVIVSTNAFGMGIDKPDVRLVVHMDIPPDLESYYQEAGRGGRDSKKAYAILLFAKYDIEQVRKSVEDQKITPTEVKNIYDALCEYLIIPVESGNQSSFNFSIDDFVLQKKISYSKVMNALKLHEQMSLLHCTEAVFTPSKIMITCSKEDLYRLELEHPQYEPLLKVLLRSYGGIFDTPVIIRESFIASRLKTTVEKVKKALVQLHTFQFISYVPESDTPKITFIQNRIPSSNLPLHQLHFIELNKNKDEKCKEMIYYVQNKEKCRTRIICRYFDEDLINDCGICDICIEQKKSKNHSIDMPNIIAKINDILHIESCSFEMLQQRCLIPDEKLNQALDWMIHTGQITQDSKLYYKII